MTRHTSYLVATLLVCAVSAAHAQISQAPQPDPALAHLPEVIQHDIAAWRDRLEHAQCIKVTLELEETWRNLHELDDDGSPRLRLLVMEYFSVRGDRFDGVYAAMQNLPHGQLLPWDAAATGNAK